MELFPTISSFPITSPTMKYHFCEAKCFCNPDDSFYEKTHFHSVYEFYINIEGNLSFMVNNQIYPVAGGDIIISRPGELHNPLYTEPTVHKYRCLWIYLEKGSPFERFFDNEDFSPRYTPSKRTAAAIDGLLSRFAEGSPTEQNEAVRVFLSLIFENTKHPEQSAAPIPKSLKAAIEYIDKSFAEIRSIADVAEQCYISVPTINRLFKKHLNTTPNDFLNMTKLSKAKKLLDDGFSVTDSCVQAGFSNCSYFIALFKKQYGLTPHQYKGTKK